MIVGKTSANVTASEVFGRYSETDVLSCYFNIRQLPCCISSPLRQDRNPSFSLYLNRSGRVRYIDFATDEHGDLMDLLCKCWNCSFTQALDRIYGDIIERSSLVLKPKTVRTFTKQERDRLSKLEVKVRPWRDYDFEYWRSYGIAPQWLAYAEVYPVSHKIVTKTDPDTGRKSRYVFAADKHAYVFVERKDRRLQLKLYQPFNTKGFKWCSKMDGSVISLWTKIPESGDRVVICSSLKDALCVTAQLRVPALALQGEGYGMSDTAAGELRRRFGKVFISFDTDKAGLADSKRLAERTGFTSVVPDLGKEKDFSDYYKSLADKKEFLKLKTLFN